MNELSDLQAAPAPALSDDWSAPARLIDPDQLSTAERLAAEALIIDVEGFEGPLDLLLALSRSQKVDLRRISVLELAEQYLEFVGKAVSLRIELAADYLVMAAWLAFLKSRLLLPQESSDGGPSAEEMAAHLAFQLERLDAMREAAAQLMARPRLGQDFFARGLPEEIATHRTVVHSANILDLMQAYARIQTRDDFRPFVLDRQHVFTMEQALERIRGLIGYIGEWSDLASFMPDGWNVSPMARRSATASNFAAALEMAKRGQITLRQGETFAPIQIRRAQP